MSIRPFTRLAARQVHQAGGQDLYEGNELARFFALLLMVSGPDLAAAPIIGAQLLRFTSWRGVFAVLAVIGAALLIVAACWPGG